MKRKNTGTQLITASIFTLLILCIAGSLSAQSLVERRPEVASGTLYLKFERGVSFEAYSNVTGVASVDAILLNEQVDKIEPLHKTKKPLYKGEISKEEEILNRIIRVYYNSDTDPVALAAELSALSEVEVSEPVPVCYPDYTPNDSYIASQWAITMMRLEEAWEITKGSKDIIIGIVDTGVQWDHPDLEGNVYINPGEWGTGGELSNNGIDDDGNGYIDDYHGWDFGNDDNDPMDRMELIGGMPVYHGTGVAGCAGAVTDNGVGIASSGFNCSILPIKAAEDDQGGNSHGYEGITYAADMGCQVINNSWGGSTAGTIQQDVVNYAWSKGSLVVASSGNDPVNHDFVPHYPSNYRHVLSVGSQDPNGLPSSYATYGASVDVLAPGWIIRTTLYGNSYEVTQGTSFSAPLLSGMAGLIFAKNPTWTNDQVAKQIRVTSAKFQAQRDPLYYGYADAYAALTENQNIDEIPGILITDFSFTLQSGKRLFTTPGEVAHCTVTFKNVLAPTTSNAQVGITFDDADQLTASVSTLNLGALNTNDTIQFTFDVTLTDIVKVAEGSLPMRFVITDGEYVDYLVERFDITIDDAWRTKYDASGFAGDTRFKAISIVSDKYLWAVAAGNNRNYCVRTINSGTSWSNAAGNGYPTSRDVRCISAIDAGKAVLGTGGATTNVVYRTTNSGLNWSYAIVGTIAGDINGIHMYDANNGLLVGDPKSKRWGIATTDDGGASWSALSSPVDTPNDSIAGWPNSFEVYENNVWFGTNQNMIYRSTDKGQTWASHTAPGLIAANISFRNELVGAARFNEDMNEDSVMVGENGIAMTNDGGLTWTMLNTIQLDEPGFIRMERLGTRMWAVNWSNVYISSDLGSTWRVEAVPRGFDSVYSAAIYSATSTNGKTVVYAGSKYLITYSSAWEPTPTAVESVSDLDRGFEINSIYPNPVSAEGRVTVQFTLGNATRTELAVYDVSGRLVRSGLNAELSSGTHSYALPTSGLPAGMYFIRLTANGRYNTRMFTVTR